MKIACGVRGIRPASSFPRRRIFLAIFLGDYSLDAICNGIHARMHVRMEYAETFRRIHGRDADGLMKFLGGSV
jgi:hypothetical protein